MNSQPDPSGQRSALALVVNNVESEMSITLTYVYYVETQMPAGPGADEVRVEREFDTDDIDQAHELAHRAWGDDYLMPIPAGYIANTLRIA